MTSERPKRRWFQLHLSTLLALTVGMGAAILLNFLPKRWNHDEENKINSDIQMTAACFEFVQDEPDSKMGYVVRIWGTPLPFNVEIAGTAINTRSTEMYRTKKFYFSNLVFDIMIWFLLLCLFVCLPEWLARKLRQRAAKKPPKARCRVSDQPPPRRSFFRVHLLTAMVMMFVAATFLYLNVNGEYKNHENTIVPGPDRALIYLRGFPYVFQIYQRERWPEYWLAKRHLLIDIGVGLSAVVASACISEFLIRRCERQRLPNPVRGEP